MPPIRSASSDPTKVLNSNPEDLPIAGEKSNAIQTTRFFLAILIGTLVLQSCVNFALNPAGAFRESGMLLSSVRSTYSYQKLEALDEFLSRNEGKEITIALGSSRVILLPGPNGTANSSQFFNAAIDGGTGEDDLAMTRYILGHHNDSVTRVYIRIDTGTLGPLSDDSWYGVRLEGVYGLETEIEDRKSVAVRVRGAVQSLINSDWFTVLKEWRSPVTIPEPRFSVSNGVDIEERTYSHRVNGEITRARLLDDHVQLLLSAAPGTRLGEQRLSDFKEAVRLWEENGTEVVLVYMPHSQPLWTGYMGVPHMRDLIGQVDDIAGDLAKSPNVIYCNFADPAVLGLENDHYWWDGWHYTADAAAIIFTGMESCATEQLGEAV